MRNILQPVVRLLASVPSVVYGLLGVLVLVPFIGNHLIGESSKASVDHIISLTGYGLSAAVLILTVMIAPLMISIFCDGLSAVRKSWLEGSLAAGRQPLAHLLEDRRAHSAPGPGRRHGDRDGPRHRRGDHARDGLGRRSGSRPTRFDGAIFLVEPSRPLAPTIITNIDGLASAPSKATLFAIGAVILFSAAMLSFAGWVARQPMKKYTAHV